MATPVAGATVPTAVGYMYNSCLVLLNIETVIYFRKMKKILVF
jgi:hypothetical protein